MRWFIWYIRALFCAHTWKYDERRVKLSYRSLLGGGRTEDNCAVSATCTQCGWHRAYKKFQY